MFESLQVDRSSKKVCPVFDDCPVRFPVQPIQAICFDLLLKRPPDEVLRTWHRIISIRGGEVGVEVVNGEVDPCPAQCVRSAGLTRWVGGYY